MKRFTALPASLITLALAAGALTGCSWFGGSNHSVSQPVLTISPGECFAAPDSVHTQLKSLKRAPCDGPHALEAYARVAYTQQKDITDVAYPGSDALTKFAQTQCAQRFQSYVGVDYLDSSLFFTYLLPSPQGWEQHLDRFVLCFIESSQALRTSSAKNSKD